MKKLLVAAMSAALFVSVVPAALATTKVPGHQDKTSGTVMGRYDSLYAYDANGDWFLDYGDGRPGGPGGTVGSVEDLDPDTLTVCDYVVIYQGSFGDDPYLDTGWIRNNVNCSGYDDNGQYNTLFIHESDRRYTGEREPIWGTWEIMIETASGQGNIAVKPHADVD